MEHILCGDGREELIRNLFWELLNLRFFKTLKNEVEYAIEYKTQVQLNKSILSHQSGHHQGSECKQKNKSLRTESWGGHYEVR